MAAQHGGYRPPTQPAPVSGPGAMSRRTDGKQAVQPLPNAKYGENAAFQAAQGAAPMSESGGGMGGAMPALAPDISGLTPMGAPTQRPNEPITAGMSGGPGAGPALPPAPMHPDTAKRLRNYLPVLIMMASRDDADPNTRQFVRQLRADLG